MVVDTVSNTISPIINGDQDHSHGACNPMKALDNQKMDAIVVGGIGAGALTRLNQMGITVHRAAAKTIQGNVELFAKQSRPVLTLLGCCGGHSKDGNCAH